MILEDETDLAVAEGARRGSSKLAGSSPSRLMRPDVGISRVPMIFKSVLFPEPLGPMIAGALAAIQRQRHVAEHGERFGTRGILFGDVLNLKHRGNGRELQRLSRC